jgi:proteasome-associated ATPase
MGNEPESSRTSRESGAASEPDKVAFLEQEIALLRSMLEGDPHQVRALEVRVAEAEARAARMSERSDQLAATLREARDQLVALKEEVDRLSQAPSGYGVFIAGHEDGTVDVFTGGRKLRVGTSPTIGVEMLRPGQEVMLNEAMNVVEAQGFERSGDVVLLRELLESGEGQMPRALVATHTDEERVVYLSDSLMAERLRPGDSLLLDSRSGYVYERIPKSEVEELILEEVPVIDYDDIGGLARQIEQIRDAVELPYVHRALFEEHQLRPPKGVLLYGPPGCGKTLIAKAMANSLARLVTAKRGEASGSKGGRSYFLNIKGPELLNKYVGETERHIRLVFQRAREKASEGAPVIVFFDEMDSIFRTRGSGISSDVESTIVPQLLSEIDGVEGLENVIVIGASNREEVIDPAILRPGRLDVKIKIGRPDADSARDIFSKYLATDLPISARDLRVANGSRELAIAHMIQRTVEYMYGTDEITQFVEVTFESGHKEVIYFSHFSSGAIIRNIVDRAKLASVIRSIEAASKGVSVSDLIEATNEEIRGVEDLMSSTNPDDWARIAGARGERIRFVRTLRGGAGGYSGKEVAFPRGNYPDYGNYRS